ncbi:DUF2179 domain-containing protein [Simiduia aestuariiviva]|uniref:Uncharacterized protein YebE (UPF0316 family) n=1 Tax=Simiduia aestuariiviva TaxID=1510459 RepID=A0A839UNX3_9GAMM|nr:DUF5698 domain-containing protein [Simiduia aestuariiviva]MBB3167258.1 uncharacterized protein YebE (UPF0316 family) [Simiduia aestuariiviva]
MADLLAFLHLHPVLLCAAIFCARLTDVSLGTLRTLMVFRGYRALSALVGFFEVLLWILAASQVITHLDQWYLAVAYAAGFAAGNYVGITLEAKLAMGRELVRVVTDNPETCLARALRAHNYSVIELAARFDDEKNVEILLISESRKRVPALCKLIAELDPKAFYTTSDIKKQFQVEQMLSTDKPIFNAGWRVIGKRK